MSVRSRFPVGHPLWPLLALVALTARLFGRADTRAADELPETEVHGWFPDHWWPYPVLAAAALITLGLLAAAGRALLEPTQSAGVAVAGPSYPDWYFLFLHELLKLGPPLVTSIVIPIAAVLVLLGWPLIDALLGSRLAARLGWRSWPAPRRNPITATLGLAAAGFLLLLTAWGLLGPAACAPWFYNGPVCG